MRFHCDAVVPQVNPTVGGLAALQNQQVLVPVQVCSVSCGHTGFTNIYIVGMHMCSGPHAKLSLCPAVCAHVN